MKPVRAHRAKRSLNTRGERSRWAPTSGAAGVRGPPGARSGASSPGRTAPHHGGAAQDSRARVWSADLGAFLQPDEYVFLTRSGTLWSWPGQNPFKYRDPSGRSMKLPNVSLPTDGYFGIGGATTGAEVARELLALAADDLIVDMRLPMRNLRWPTLLRKPVWRPRFLGFSQTYCLRRSWARSSAVGLNLCHQTRRGAK